MDSKFLGLNPVMYQLQLRKAKPSSEFSGFRGLVVGSYLKISLASLYPFRVILIHHALCKLSLQLHPPLYLFFYGISKQFYPNARSAHQFVLGTGNLMVPMTFLEQL